MTSEDAGGKSAPTKSGAVLSQEDRQEHQQEGQPPQSGEGTEVLGEAAVRHDANSPAAGRGEAGDQTNRGEREQHVRPLRDWGGVVAIANVVLAFVGVGGIFFAAFQLGAMRDQLDQMKITNNQAKRQADAAENSNKLAYRPWITISPLGRPNFESVDVQKIDIGIKNNGRTPAFNVMSNFKMVATYRPTAPVPPPIDGALNGLGAIFSEATYKSTLTAELAVGRKYLPSLNGGPLTYYIIGEMHYNDVFGDPHKIIYCSYIDGRSDSFILCPEPGRNSAD